jgi:ribosomal protein L12E/L44/L45/RPP1/RPP2
VVLALAASGPGLGAAWERAQQQRLQEQGEEEEEEEEEKEEEEKEGARRGERQPCGGSWRW